LTKCNTPTLIEIQVSSESVIVDRKIKFHVDPPSAVALKHLRARIQRMIQSKLGGRKLITPELSDTWESLAMAVLGKLSKHPSASV
jgi:hypothetical protein